MKVSRNWLQTYFDKEIPAADKLAELFTFHAFEVEEIKEVKDENENVIDSVIDVKVLPDRAHYALCHKGIAHEVSILAKLPMVNHIPPSPIDSISNRPEISILDFKFCRRYIGRYVDIGSGNCVNGKSADWISKFLNAIGERSINPIVDATNLTMFHNGQPLHAFDADKVSGKIVVRQALSGEKIALLDSSNGPGKEIELTINDYVIADDIGPLAIAGVKGGKRAAIGKDTKHLIIESANFDPTAVRRTANKYDLRSESSKRFENEITPELAIMGMDNICALIKEMMPDAKFGPIVDVYPEKVKQTVIEFDSNYIEERLGIKILENDTLEILKAMNICINNTSSNAWQLTIPYERLDLVIKEDIVEEIGRIYGYEHVKGILPPKEDKKVNILPMYYLCEKIRNTLVGAGFSEVSLYSLVEKGDIEVVKPLAKDKSFARKNLFDGMMNCIQKNALNADLLGLDTVKVFEIGHVFNENNGERIKLALGVAQVKKIKGLKAENIILDAIKLIGNIDVRPIQNGNYFVCEIDLNELLNTTESSAPVYSFSNLNFTTASKGRFKKFSLYPFIVRDIAIFVPELIAGGTSIAFDANNVWGVIERRITASSARELLVRYALFDVFRKDGKISYAFRLVFQSMERTLTDDEVNKIMTDINLEVINNKWEVR